VNGVKSPPPTHRYPSAASPSHLLPAPAVRTEDDVLYRPNLPDFANKYGQVSFIVYIFFHTASRLKKSTMP